MKIIFYDTHDVAGGYLVEIDSLIIPHKGDEVSFFLEDGTVYGGKVLERSFIVEGNELSFINIVCIGKRA